MPPRERANAHGALGRTYLHDPCDLRHGNCAQSSYPCHSLNAPASDPLGRNTASDDQTTQCHHRLCYSFAARLQPQRALPYLLDRARHKGTWPKPRALIRWQAPIPLAPPTLTKPTPGPRWL
jgi:hypothetical protein